MGILNLNKSELSSDKSQSTKHLSDLEAELLSANVCPELSAAATKLVFGEGSSTADLMFIGEAPGKKEDLTGKPFIGASGKILDQLLDAIKLPRASVYVTSIVKYRPPANRDPTKEEKLDMLPYLLRQIRIIKPKIVVTLGRHSGQAFLPDLRIGADHGQPKTISLKIPADYSHVQTNSPEVRQVDMTFIVLPLYHPAAALYNGSLRSTLFDDFMQIPRILKSN